MMMDDEVVAVVAVVVMVVRGVDICCLDLD